MKYLKFILFLASSISVLSSCGDDIDDFNKIDGQWKLESISGGIAGGAPVNGEITMGVKGKRLDLFKDGELIMDAKISYKKDDVQLFINIDRSYKIDVPSFIFGSSDKMKVSLSADNNALSLFEGGSDSFNYNFIMAK